MRAGPCLALALTAMPAPAAAAGWTMELSGGLAALADQGSQPFVALTLSHDMGPWQMRGGLAWFDGGSEADAMALLPARTWQGTLGAGYAAGPVLVDVYASLGRRSFDPVVRDAQSGRTVRIEAEGGLFTIGGSVTVDAPLGPGWSAAPFVSASYSAVDSVRTLIPPAGAPLVDERTEQGITGTIGVTVGRDFDRGSLGVYVAGAATSNRASADRQGSATLATRVPRLLAGDDESDAWLEYGVSGSIALSQTVSLDAAVIRTAGFADGETTSLSAGLRIRF
jgi:hypothetical protein